MKTINNHSAQTAVLSGRAVIVDVREPAEFHENHIPGAINLPSTTFDKNHYSAFSNLQICLICESGKRAEKIGRKLQAEGFENISLLDKQMQHITKLIDESGWTIDRQFRMTLGILIALFLTLHFFSFKWSIIIPAILCIGLIFTSLIDRCYMRIGIAMLPWNKGKKIPD
jgi:rhodanese-related sulfurtransferase